MLNINQVKQRVLKKVEDTGYLDNIRAQMKTQVFQIIQSQSQQNKKTLAWQWKHASIQKLNKLDFCQQAIKLLQQFLQFYKFQYTLTVFKKQISRKQKINRKQLSQSLKFKQIKQDKPILLSLIQKYMTGEGKTLHVIDNNKSTNGKGDKGNEGKVDKENKGDKGIQNNKGSNQRPLTAPLEKPKQQSGKNKIRGFSGSKSTITIPKDPYNFQIETSPIKKNKYSIQNVQKKDYKTNNPLLSSSQSMLGASQSHGYDNSVDSEQIQGYDFYQKARKKKK